MCTVCIYIYIYIFILYKNSFYIIDLIIYCELPKYDYNFIIVSLYSVPLLWIPSFGEAYRDRRLTINFELWVEIFCVPTCFHVRIPKPSLSVCPYHEKRNHLSFVNISPTLVIDTSMESSSRVLQHENLKNWSSLKKNTYLNVSAVMYCKQFLAYTVHIDRSVFLCNP